MIMALVVLVENVKHVKDLSFITGGMYKMKSNEKFAEEKEISQTKKPG